MLSLSVFFCTTGCFNTSVHPVNGIISLDKLAVNEMVELNGEWEFYWDKLYLGNDFNTPEAAADKKYLNYKTNWKNAEVDGWEVPDTGYATYRLKVILPREPDDKILMHIPYYDMPVNVYCNNQLVFSNGTVGTTVDSSKITSYYPYLTEVNSENGILELVIHASNFRFPGGGIREAIIIGCKESMSRFIVLTTSIEMILIGCLLIMCIYDLILFFITKRNMLFLNFSIVCFASALLSMVNGVSIVGQLGMPWESIVLIRYLSWSIAVYFYYKFFTILFNHYNNKIISAFYTVSTIIICIVIAAANFSVYNYIYYSITFLYFFSILYYLAVSFNEFINKKENSILLLFSFILLFPIMFLVKLSHFAFNQYNIVSPAEIVLFCIIQSIIIGKNINANLKANNDLNKALFQSNSELTVLNKHLELLVAEKTDELKHQNMEISEKNQQINNMNLNLEKRVRDSIAEIHQKDDMLIINSRQAAMGELLGFIVHQWKQNIYGISLYIEGLKNLLTQRGSLDVNVAREPLEKIDSSIIEMYSTFNDFNNFLKPGKDVEFFSMKGAIEGTINMMYDFITINSVEIMRDYNGDPSLIGFSNELKQVLMNIIKNSIDAFNERFVNDRKIVISISRSDDMNCLRIRDNAGGIKMDNPVALFDKFNTSKKTGTGLGLYISKIIIEQRFGGKIEVHNNENGAVFTISIPVFTENTNR